MISDIIGFNRAGDLRLVVEVKRKFPALPDWAAQMRRNLIAHGPLAHADFFLLATPDRLFLWRKAPFSLEPRLPDYSCATTEALGPYLGDVGPKLHSLSEDSLQLAVGGWLSSLSRDPNLAGVPHDVRELLEDSGLLAAITGGRIAHEVGR